MTIKPTEDATLRNNKGDDDIYIEDVSVEYSQYSATDNDYNTLRVFTENNGVARYLNISTEKWEFSDIDELIEILNDFKKRAGL
jgi:hypothetical protein